MIRLIGGLTGRKTLFYFPITFAGVTQFLPAQPYQQSSETERADANTKWIPSDTVAFRMYSESLEKVHGHNLSPPRLIEAFHNYGGRLLHQGPSNWIIDPTRHQYLWQTMLYFFGVVAGPPLLRGRWDSSGWFQRIRTERPTIMASNTDLLFELGVSPSNDNKQDGTMQTETSLGNDSDDSCNDRLLEIEEIQFTAPRTVGTQRSVVQTKDNQHLGPNQVEGKRCIAYLQDMRLLTFIVSRHAQYTHHSFSN